ncbi:DODA-type extradiol aromatic ring-opening family dioxygenase [Shewanella khirikhana]|uniref:LigB family dioxygenase n=1 Tax=Shewanella khirikhana TaxID=1965282 RepID=A0ABN5TX54_9GAMM|nr:class III extradiol ring-cleavage dioxygenase [Shewanella khirikhana]AZQ11816.1 LigB family dioxygenase [Shewanella khirikhana]
MNTSTLNATTAPVLFIPHGGGPLPLLGDPGHQELVAFLKALPASLPKPDAILVISAHWEESQPTITGAEQPGLIYDYYGFAPESYQIRYPAPGQPVLARRIKGLLAEAGIAAHIDNERGFDHGMFVPLALMYPEANIPCVQLSLVKGLSPAQHIAIGKALAALKNDNVLILGSGFSFHNLREFRNGATQDLLNLAFEDWLAGCLLDTNTDAAAKASALIHWQQAPGALHCHPREEHLLPLHLCFGAAGDAPARQIFDGHILGKKSSGWQW